MSFKRKVADESPLRLVPEAIESPALLDDVESLDFVDWYDADCEYSWCTYSEEYYNYPVLSRWYKRHLSYSESERAHRLTAIDNAVEGLLAAYPGTRVSATGYLRVAKEDWSDFTVAVILDVTRTMRKSVKALPSSAVVYEAMKARTSRAEALFHDMTRHRRTYDAAAAKGRIEVDALVAELAARGSRLSAADLHGAHDVVSSGAWGTQTMNAYRAPYWANMMKALRAGEPWAASWIEAAAAHSREDCRDKDPDTDDDKKWGEWCSRMNARSEAIREALTRGQAPSAA